MNIKVRRKLLDYKSRLTKVKDCGVQRVTSALENGGINVCLCKLPIVKSDDWMLVTEKGIWCPLCRENKAVLIGPAHYWHPTEINCHNCGLHVSAWKANQLCIKEVKNQWKLIEQLKLKDIVPFGESWHKRENR